MNYPCVTQGDIKDSKYDILHAIQHYGKQTRAIYIYIVIYIHVHVHILIQKTILYYVSAVCKQQKHWRLKVWHVRNTVHQFKFSEHQRHCVKHRTTNGSYPISPLSPLRVVQLIWLSDQKMPRTVIISKICGCWSKPHASFSDVKRSISLISHTCFDN